MDDDPAIYVADAGSVSRGNFHWVNSRNIENSSTDPVELASAIADDLIRGSRVSLGYESPLFVPLLEDPYSLGRSRTGECQEETGNRPFTAGAGAAVLATGIQSLAWVLREIKRRAPSTTTSTRWSDFHNSQCRLFVWEAFVSGSEKASPLSHAGDAALAISAFLQVSSDGDNPTRIACPSAFSLAGAAIVASGLSDDVGLLTEPCVVLRPIFSTEESKRRLTEYKQRQANAKSARLVVR